MNTSKTFAICLGVVVLLSLAVLVFKISFDTLILGALLLACPLLHIFMIKKGGHKH